MVGQCVEPPLSVVVDREEGYHMSSIGQGRVYRNLSKYLLRLTGYDSLTWELPKCVDVLEAVGEFHQQYHMKLRPLESVLRGPRT